MAGCKPALQREAVMKKEMKRNEAYNEEMKRKLNVIKLWRRRSRRYIAKRKKKAESSAGWLQRKLQSYGERRESSIICIGDMTCEKC